MEVPELLIHRKILFERNNFARNDLHTPQPTQLAQMTTTITQTSFRYYWLKIQNFSLKFML